MSASLRRVTRERAGDRCEYCRLAQVDCVVSFHVEHVIPRQHGGWTVSENLALACPNCNLHKGPNLTGIDPDSQEISRLFHPRTDLWNDHFRQQGGKIIGTTAMGRTTVWLLKMNDEEQVGLRSST